MPKTQDDYYKDFPRRKRKQALAEALDIRKFEIEMYWKRATYFWTLFAATLAGYSVVQSDQKIVEIVNPGFLSVLLASLGLVFSVAWLCVNKGSKQWQENWENHVNMLEDHVIGPLYKTVLYRRDSRGTKERLEYMLTGPGSFSVSGINQIISWYVVMLWALLLWRALPSFVLCRSLPPFWLCGPIQWEYAIVVGFSLLTCAMFIWLARTHHGEQEYDADTRHASIKPDA